MTVTAAVRAVFKVRGVVQGVGFRPSVYRLAVEHRLAGFVRNDGDGVTIEIEGDEVAVASFGAKLALRAPAAARIDAIHSAIMPARGEPCFRVEPSRDAEVPITEIPTDRATCDACMQEMFDPENRRYRYPFITCTDCGPRYTIIRGLPYDRSRTTMASFEMCEACRREHDDPRDRRFHSQTNSCHRCGPRLIGDLAETADRLRSGQIVAIKGLGGFHLAADATSELAISRLRERKRRPAKPFAVMARDLETVAQYVFLDNPAREALSHPARPIVCLPSRHELPAVVAPRLHEIGIFLPYAPLHHLLLAEIPVLIMTSGNERDEPIVIENHTAVERLGSIADAFLLHDRPIHRRADDSVVRIVASVAQPLRRSRGWVPEALPLPFAAPPVLAVGAELKNTICVTRDRAAFVSPHVGDLSHPRAYEFFESLVRDARPTVIAHDLHPDYRSTRWALESGLPRIAVQHHHAHIASCLIDNERTDPVIGVSFDGTGCGPAGELWGGEFLLCDLGRFVRKGHLRSIALPGGEAAIHEPWRLAIAALIDAGLPIPESGKTVAMLIEKEVRCPKTTSAGRWFDAVAALCGFSDRITYEGQAAIELEAIAAPDGNPYSYEITEGEIDLRPMIREIVANRETAAVVSARFHETLAQSTAEMCEQIGGRTVALSGGCFQNKRLTERLKAALEARGFEVLLHRRVPPNDGGISLGQAAVAAWKLLCA